MYSASKVKPTLLSPKGDTTRNFHNTFSPKLGSALTNPADILAYHKELLKQSSPTNRDSQKVPHFLPKGTQSPIHYKNKRPVEIADLGETDRQGLNSSIPASYEARPSGPYGLGNSQNIPNSGTPFLSTREGQGEGLLDADTEMTGASYRTAYSGQKANNNNAGYLAEKVYSMKMKGPGIMGTLLPLSKSKSPTGLPMSTKNVSSTTPNKSGFREADSYQSCVTTNARSGIGYQSEMNNHSMVNKKGGTESNKSLGKGLNERKAINSNTPLQDNQMKRDNSWGKIKKTQQGLAGLAQRSDKKIATPVEKAKPKTIVHYSPNPYNKKGVSVQDSLNTKLDVLVNKISMVCWQSNQRNKRGVFVLLMENWRYTENKLAKHLERRAAVIKSKCFCLWQEFLLEVNLERQRIQQEKAEEMKIALADMFHDRKLLRKTFYLLRMANEILPKTLPKSSAIPSKSAKSLRHPSISMQKSPSKPNPIPVTSSGSTVKPGHTPQSKSKIMMPKQKSISEKKPLHTPASTNITNTTTKTASKPGLPPKVQAPFDIRSKSVGKILKDTKSATATTPKSQASQYIVTDSSKLNNSGQIDSPRQKETSINYSRNEKTAHRVYETSEIEEATEVSQSPNKGRNESPGIGESIGCGSFGSFEKGKDAFDFILADILHTSESPKGPEHAVSMKLINQEQIDEEDLPKVVVAKSETFKNSPQKNNFMLKLDAVAKTTREYSTSPIKSAKATPRKQSFTYRNKYEESKVGRNSNKKIDTLSPPTPPKRTVSARVRTNPNDEEPENVLERVNLEKALAYRRKRLLQIPFIWLLAAAAQTKEELEEKTIMAEINYQNSLKIKSLSGLLEHFVQAFKQNQLYKQYYETNLLRSCFEKWSLIVPPKSKSEIDYDSDGDEDNYGEIVERFRFIVLAEKAIRQWKSFIASNKKPVVQKNRRY